MLLARHLSRRLSSSAARCALARAAVASSSAARCLDYPASISISSGLPSPPITITCHALPSLGSPPTSLPSRAFSDSASSLKESYDHILVESRFPEDGADVVGGGVGVITLHRPKALNALCDALFEDLIHALNAFEDDDDIGCVVITGSGKAFAAGADISEMSKREFATVYKKNMFSQWADVTRTSKPIIAAVNGFALGGGCELAMMCDILLASSKAKFGQPEINLGVIPGAGGTQRLVRAVGKSKAMEMVLTANMIGAQEAMEAGLVSRVIEPEELLDEAVKMGFGIAEKGGVAVRMCKEAVNVAEEMTLSEGLRFERRMFHALFATKDQKEGMAAFLEKRKPNFTNE